MAEMGDAIMEAHRLNQELIALQKELIAAVGLPPHEHPAGDDRPACGRRSTTGMASSSARSSRS